MLKNELHDRLREKFGKSIVIFESKDAPDRCIYEFTYNQPISIKEAKKYIREFKKLI